MNTLMKMRVYKCPKQTGDKIRVFSFGCGFCQTELEFDELKVPEMDAIEKERDELKLRLDDQLRLWQVREQEFVVSREAALVKERDELKFQIMVLRENLEFFKEAYRESSEGNKK